MKRIYNTDTNRTIWRGENYVVDGIEVTTLPSPLVLATDVRAETPTYDAATHKLVRIPDSLVGTEWRMNRYDVVALTEQERIDRRNADADAADQTMDAVTIKALVRATLPVDADDDTLATLPNLFPAWRPGQTYTAGDLLQHGNQTMRVVQGHTSQTDWDPLATPAIYSVLVPTPPGATYPAWQVWNSDPATLYQIGDRVTHNELDWEATTGDNHWEPGVFGWAQI